MRLIELLRRPAQVISSCQCQNDAILATNSSAVSMQPATQNETNEKRRGKNVARVGSSASRATASTAQQLQFSGTHRQGMLNHPPNCVRNVQAEVTCLFELRCLKQLLECCSRPRCLLRALHRSTVYLRRTTLHKVIQMRVVKICIQFTVALKEA